MARSTPGVTRQRILDAAIQLFSTKGYAATSVADIQVACGLAAGSGALYKHFPSKKALLEEVVRRHVATMEARRAETTTDLPDDPREVLRLAAGAVWGVLETDREPLRIMLRELDRFPDLLELMWDGVLANLYREATAWIVSWKDRGLAEVADPEASTAVILSSLTYYPILNALTGLAPGDVEPQRFLDAWVVHAAATLGLRE